MMKQLSGVLVLAAATSAVALPFPSKPIKLIVPFSAGSGTGNAVTALDPWADRLALAAAAGLPVARRLDMALQPLARHAVVVSSLPDDKTLLDVAWAIAAQAPPGITWVDTSTVPPEASAQAASSMGGRCVRAPVSGNITMAVVAAGALDRAAAAGEGGDDHALVIRDARQSNPQPSTLNPLEKPDEQTEHPRPVRQPAQGFGQPRRVAPGR